MERIMYIEPGGGLCNRIGVMNYGIILARRYGFRPVIVWKNNGEIACDYEDVFDNTEHIEIKNLYYPLGSPKAMVKSGKLWQAIRWKVLTARAERYRRHLQTREIELYDGSTMPRSEANAINEKTIEQCSQDWIYIHTYQCAEMDYDYSWVHFAQRFDERVTKLTGTDTGHMVGVHIRRTDHRFATEANPIESFENKMQECINDDEAVKFYVASDDAGVIARLKNKFGERVIINEGAELTRQSKTGIEDAVVDLLALSRCRHIIGSRGSTFSDIASFIGNATLEYADRQKEDIDN